MNKANIALVVALVAVVIATSVYFVKVSGAKLFGSTACSGITCLSGGLRLVTDTGGDFESDVAAVFSSTFKLGASGTAQANQVVTTCSMIANNVSTGTTTQYAYCTGVTGVTSSDKVSASFATSTTNFNDGWQIVGAKASTTAGAIDFTVIGIAGKAMSNVSTIGSTTNIFAAH